jgi:hypothetical protein
MIRGGAKMARASIGCERGRELPLVARGREGEMPLSPPWRARLSQRSAHWWINLNRRKINYFELNETQTYRNTQRHIDFCMIQVSWSARNCFRRITPTCVCTTGLIFWIDCAAVGAADALKSGSWRRRRQRRLVQIQRRKIWNAWMKLHKIFSTHNNNITYKHIYMSRHR